MALLALISVVTPMSAWAADSQAESKPEKKLEKKPEKRDESTRNFYSVLDDLISDFEFDLKNGQVTGIRDLSVRNVSVNELVPASFKNHLELVITERLLKTGKVRMVQCLSCRAKKTVLSGDQMVISSPESNPQEMARIARQSGIQNFMDIAFSYQPNGMVLSLYITEAETGSVAWSRSYNSETSRSSAYRRGVDFSQPDPVRSASEYLPVVQYRVALQYGLLQNVSETTGVLGIAARVMERYDNRKKEVGFELDYFRTASGLVGAAATSSTDLYSGLNLTMLFTHAWNLIGEEENYNKARGSIVAGIGGTYASGFLGGLIRGGYEWRLARHWAVSAAVGYRPSATKFVGTTESGTISGMDYMFGVSALF